MPSASRARWIISNRSPAVNGFSPVWLYWADPMPMISSSWFSRTFRTIARWPLWNGWNLPMRSARLVLIPAVLEKVVQVLAGDGQVLPAVDAAGVVPLRRERGVELEAGESDELVLDRLVLHPTNPQRSVRDRAPGPARGRRGLRDDRRELPEQALLLRPADQGVLADLQEDILHVRRGDEDLPDPHLGGRLDLRGHPADGEDLPADAQGPRHRDALVHLDALEGADHRRRDGDGRAVPLRALPGADELDVDVVVRDVLARVLLDQGRD